MQNLQLDLSYCTLVQFTFIVVNIVVFSWQMLKFAAHLAINLA